MDTDRPPGQDGPGLAGLMGRRRALSIFGAGLVALAGCGSSSDDDASGPSSSSADTSVGSGASSSAPTTGGTSATTALAGSDGTCETVPEETAGPFPGDGSNGPDVLAEDGVVRRDIRPSLTGGTVAEGIPLTVDLTLVDTADGCAPLADAAVYIWHCDRGGLYSMYSPGATELDYLRGVQVADADGKLSFTSIFPGAYAGRWPHIHFEVYSNVDDARAGAGKIKTSQIALPEDTCNEVYATEGYEQSVVNMRSLSLETDMVFADGYDLQMANMTGTVPDGLSAALTVAV